MNKILIAMCLIVLTFGLVAAGLTSPLNKKHSPIPEGCYAGPVDFNGQGDFKIKIKVPRHENPMHMGRLVVYSGDIVKAKNVKVMPMPLLGRTAIKFQKGGEVHLKGNINVKLMHLGYKYEVKAKKGFTYDLGQMLPDAMCTNLKLKPHQKFN